MTGADAGTSPPTGGAVDAAPAPGVDDVSVEALENIGGKKEGVLAYRAQEQRGENMRFRWLERKGGKIVTHKWATSLSSGEYCLPSLLVLDGETLYQDATWTEDFETESVDVGTSTQHRMDWKIEAMDEEVTVPAGTFRSVHLRKLAYQMGETEPWLELAYWYAPGIGMVKRQNIPRNGGETGSCWSSRDRFAGGYRRSRQGQ